MNFQLETTTAKLMYLNLRDEHHGDQIFTGIDIGIKIVTGNGILSEFHSSLRHFLFIKDEADKQTSIDDENDGGQLTVLRMGSLIDGLVLNYSLKGAEIVIGFGIGGPSDIQLEAKTVDKFVVKVSEGGTVALTFKISVSKPGSENIKKLSEILGREIDIAVTPAVEKQTNLELETA